MPHPFVCFSNLSQTWQSFLIHTKKQGFIFGEATGGVGMISETHTIQKVQHQCTTKPKNGFGVKFRPPGSPAGTWPHTPWWHCVFLDPYERVNVWSHGVPAVIFILIGVLAVFDVVPGAHPMAFFCVCATVTHSFSALTHVFPDHHGLEKLDHIGIIALLLGTPVSALWAKHPEANLSPLLYVLLFAFFGAFLKPLLRTCSFVLGGAATFVIYWQHIICTDLVVQIVLYVFGGICFLRNDGHSRAIGFSDHHFLHYFVTVACFIHCKLLIDAASN